MLQDAAGAVSARAVAKVEEATVIRAVQRGDRDALEQLVRAYDQSVFRLAMSLLRSPGAARDGSWVHHGSTGRAPPGGRG